MADQKDIQDVTEAGHKSKVEGSISTTAGFFPEHGYDEVSQNQPIRQQLEKADHKLGIKDTAGWVATVNEGGSVRRLNIDESYKANRLDGKVDIDWGPSEGGGG